MRTSPALRIDRPTRVGAELRKLTAFLRRDLLVALTYRMSFVTDWISMIAQMVVFLFMGKIVRPGSIPSYSGHPASYVEFVAIGIAVSSFMAVGLERIFTAIRQEQLQGTLEMLLLTPTALTTIQLGSVVYDLLYVPVRTFLFLGLTTIFIGTRYDWSGLTPTILVLLAFIPFVWGLGVMAAAWTLTFKRGTGAVGLVVGVLTLGSGAYFPTDVLPGWAQGAFHYSPVTMALKAARDALLGGGGFAVVMPIVLTMIPFAAASLALGIFSFRLALGRERRRGSLGLY
jgi:ABC-2 type transport system permease protein